jgi:RNA polymerase sigma-70 factor (ECF subfamily)
MGAEPQQGLTLILRRARAGDEWARGELVALVDDELRRDASRLVPQERADHGSIPEAWLRAREAWRGTPQ